MSSWTNNDPLDDLNSGTEGKTTEGFLDELVSCRTKKYSWKIIVSLIVFITEWYVIQNYTFHYQIKYKIKK